MKKCCFIIPYFGKFPNYFPLFLRSCSYNKDFNWLIFTDDKTPYEYPENVKVIYTEFQEIRRYVDKALGMHVALEKPYKFCDLKPTYGYLFQSYLKDYAFWGHCDIDLIFGKISHFINDDIFRNYDKIGCLGHFTLYKNTPEINSMFMHSLNGEELYKEFFSTPTACIFDEEWNDKNINAIFREEGKRIYSEDISMNSTFLQSSFQRVKFVGKNITNTKRGFKAEPIIKNCLYIWELGSIFRFYIRDKKLIKEEFGYMHFQQREMEMDPSVLKLDKFKIIPNKFVPLEVVEVNINNFNTIIKNGHPHQYLQIISKRIKRKIKKLLDII